jgi:hypothetical protein
MGQSKFRLCNSIFLQNSSLRKQKCQKLKKISDKLSSFDDINHLISLLDNYNVELNAKTESGNHHKIKGWGISTCNCCRIKHK